MLNGFMRKTKLCLLAAVVISAQFGLMAPLNSVAEAADNGLAQKPLMGWSSYSQQVYHENGMDWVSGDKIKAQSDAMHTTLQPYGYEYINIDAGWNGSFDEYGRPQPKESLYPNGFQEIIDYVHNNGQKIGLYAIPGLSKEVYDKNLPIYGTPYHAQDIVVLPLTTADYWGIDYKIDFSKPGAKEYIKSIADQFGEWGIDFLKFDSVTPGSGINNTSIDARGDVEAWSEALKPHNIWLELSWALDHNYVDTWKKYANGWRVEWDIESYTGPGTTLTKWENIARLFPVAAQWWRDAGPGGWNDFDSMNIGNGSMDGLTRDERQTTMTFWAVSAAQLYIGNDMTNLDSYGISLLTNPEVIAVNQAGRPAHPVSIATNQQVWYSNNGDGSYNVALFNLGNVTSKVNVNWSDIGLNGSASVRDLWSHTDMGINSSGLSNIQLEPHASRLFKVTAVNGKASVNDDESGVKYTGTWSRNDGNELVADSQDLNVVVADTSVQTSNSSNVSGDAANTGSGANAAAAERAMDIAESSTVSYSVYANDTDPNIIYGGASGDSENGRWGYSSGRSLNDYNSDVHYGQSEGANFEYSFSGTGIEFLTERDTAHGDIDIYVDGQFMETVSAYGSPQTGQYTVYQISGLENGPHTLKGVKAGGSYMIVDAFQVTSDSLLGKTADSFDKNHPADVTTTLTLGSGPFIGISNGGTALTRGTDYTIQGNTVTIKKEYLLQQSTGGTKLIFGFTGNAAQIFNIEVAQTAANSGISPIAADFDKKLSAQADVLVSLELNGNSLVGIWNGDVLLTENSDYTVTDDSVTIKKSYLSQLAAGVTNLTFEFSAGIAANLSVTVNNSASSGRYLVLNDDDSKIVYSNGWSRNSGRTFGDYMEDVHYAENNGESFEYTFQGTGIQYITELDSSQGEIDMYLDGQFQKTINTWNAQQLAQQVVYSVSGLSNGFHTLKGVKKSGRFMLVDSLKVQLPDLIDISEAEFDKNLSAQADLPVTVMENIANLSGISNGTVSLVKGTDYVIEGNTVTIKKEYLAAKPVGTTRLTFSFKGDYQNDVHFTTTAGDYYEYTFKGTGVELFTPKGPDQGEMDIYIDGELVGTASAINETRSVQESVFSTSGLAEGFHTIKVVNKSGGLMLVDRLQFTVETAVPETSASPTPTATPTPTPTPSTSTPSTVGTPAVAVEIVKGSLKADGAGGSALAIDISRTVQTDGTKKDNLKLTAAILDDYLTHLKDTGVLLATIVIPDDKDEVSQTDVTVEKEAVKLLAGRGMSLGLYTANAEIIIPASSLTDVGEDVHFTIVPVKSEAQSNEIQKRANILPAILAASGGKEAKISGRPVSIDTNLQNREVTLTLPLKGAQPAEAIQTGVYIEHSDGTVEFKTGTVSSFGSGEGVQFTVNKFSTFSAVTLEGQKERHSSYINGYADGTFKPLNSLTRAEMATLLSRVVPEEANGGKSVFNDVTGSHWASEAIVKVTQMGLMKGYPDGSFRPDQPITRAETASLLAGILSVTPVSGPGFKDTVGNWAESSIRLVQGAGIASGYEDGAFRPAATLTRAEAVAMINRALGRGPLTGIQHSTWKDVPDGYWALQDIEEASIDHNFEQVNGSEVYVN